MTETAISPGNGCKTILWRHLFVQSGGLDTQPKADPWISGISWKCSLPWSRDTQAPGPSSQSDTWPRARVGRGLQPDPQSTENSPFQGVWWSRGREGITPTLYLPQKTPSLFPFQNQGTSELLRWAGEFWSGPGRWRPLVAHLGGGRGGIIFLMPLV